VSRRPVGDLGEGAALAAGAALVLGVLALAGVPVAVVIGVGGAAGFALTLAGLHHRRVPRTALTEAWPWALAAVVLWTVGSCADDAARGEGGVALAGLALEVVALVALAVGLLARSWRVAENDPLPLVDAAVVMAAGAFPGFIVLTQAVPEVAAPTHRTLLYAGQVAAVLLIGAVGYAFAVGEPRRAASTTLLTAAGVAAVLAHGLDQYVVLRSGSSGPVDALLPAVVAVMPLLVGAAAWAPDAAVDLAARRATRVRTGLKQILLVGGAALLVPAVIGIELARGGAVHLGEGIVLAFVLITLVMTRVVVIVRRLGRQAALLEARLWTDPATGLGNREALLGRLDELAEAGQRREVLALVGLDRLTELRDALGAGTADVLLHAVGARLAEAAPGGYVARVGSGVFGVLLPAAEDRDHAHVAVRTLLSSLDSPLVLGELTLRVTAAAGVVIVGEDGSGEQLLQGADLALGEAWQAPGRVASRSSGDGSGAGLALLLPDLRAALENGDLVLHFQPQVGIASARVTGVEALLRWQHPTHGLIAPGAFIPLAERTGFIVRITRYVLDAAMAHCASCRAGGVSLAVAVNLSVHDLLDPGLVDFVSEALTRHGLPASALELEVTETDAMVDPQRSVATMTGLAALGVVLSVDDFGTGYSSLSYLGRLPVRRLKIDREFVAGLRVDEASLAIVAATIELARRLGLEVVAEGVEDDETYRELAAMGCDGAQGFGLSRPVPADAVHEVVKALDARLARERPALPTGS
jgi:diguanylate cyclase (GGDEF)-like protein